MEIKFNISMKDFTSFKIGGNADLFIDLENLEELKKIIKFAYKNRIHVFILGRGTNILVKNEGIRGIVIRLKKEFENINLLGNSIVKAGAGCLLNKVVYETAKIGLTGLEGLAGIPGTVGGACVVNAGTMKGEIGARISSITCLTKEGELKKINKNKIKFKYRHTNLMNRDIVITEVLLKLTKDTPENCKSRIDKYLAERKLTQPLNFPPSAGCIFKNPKNNLPAGRLIEEAGLKGKRLGDVEVSKVHANFIINRKNGRAEDVLKLIKLIQNKVKKKFRIELEKEIIIVG